MLNVILLIYEYTISVESSNLVQRRRGLIRKLNGTVLINDTPVADRLDRSYFGFDQDYFEQMPLLVNAMQENSYVDPAIDMSMPSNNRGKHLKNFNTTTTTPISIQSHKPIAIRRTSPRPFIFEYRSPTPVPFHKNYNSRSWVESYRNAQRLKNLEQVISYLEKTIHAKFGDLYTLPSSTQIGFSGVYMQPALVENKPDKTTTKVDLLPQSSNTVHTFKRENHKSDPYFSFKPESPGDVNLLADGPYRFSLVPTASLVSKTSSKIPMFRPVHRPRGCVGTNCKNQNIESKLQKDSSLEINTSEVSPLNKPKSFSVMLNVFPITTTQTTYYKRNDAHNALDKIYFTTSRPQFQFRRKTIGSTPRRRSFVPKSKRPRKIYDSKIESSGTSESKSSEIASESNQNTKMVLHVNVFPKNEMKTTTTSTTTTTTTAETPKSSTQYNIVNTPHVPTCFPLCSVEDYHVGSSGVVPIELRTFSPSTDLPKVTTVTPFFGNSEAGFEATKSWPTSPPDILKFSQEDAKIPEEYQRLRESEELHQYAPINVNRRNSREDFNDADDIEQRTLIIKLRNYLESTTQMTTTPEDVSEESFTEAVVSANNFSEETDDEKIYQQTTTIQTYVPQINGHYRSVNQNSRQINDWYDTSSGEERIKRLEIRTLNRPMPKYVEIKRNRSATANEYVEE